MVVHNVDFARTLSAITKMVHNMMLSNGRHCTSEGQNEGPGDRGERDRRTEGWREEGKAASIGHLE